MRLYCIALLAGIAASTGASASSFVTLPLHGDVSPSVMHLGTAPDIAAAAKPVEAVTSQVRPNETLPTLRYPPPMPRGLDVPVAQTRVSASVIAMGAPAVEDFEVAAVKPEKPARSLFASMPLVMRGGIRGDAFPGGHAASTPETVPVTQASAPTGKPKPEPAKAPEPAEDDTAEPPAPPNGIAPLKGVQ